MHGLNFGLISGILRDAMVVGTTRTTSLPPLGVPKLPFPIRGMRNLLPLRNPTQVFGRGQHSEDALRALMRKMAVRMAREPDWPDKLPGAVKPEDNPTLPSGYTYLLQLIAHDIVHTSTSLALADRGHVGFENCRVKPLMLETIFGGGPDVCPHAYEFSKLCRDHQRGLPRTRLRVGRTQHDGGTKNMPFNDIGRGTPVDAKDDGIIFRNKTILSDACVADPRNDDHALISQLTVLFHRLHNLIMDMIEDVPEAATVQAYRNFLCARLVSSLIYRRIIVWDLLERLLDPSVFRYYVMENRPLVASGTGVPIEFSQGAFRCGHAMVRSSYRVNSDQPIDTARAWQLSSLRSPTFLPVTDTWTVRWENFFELDGTVPNHSRRLGPSFSTTMRSETFFPRLRPDIDAAGLPNRDLVSAIYAQVWSVPALIDELRGNPEIAAFLPPYDAMKKPISDWLNATANPAGITEQLTAVDVTALAEDAPLAFFVLFEAAFTGDSPAAPFKKGGQHLGPLGSIIIAETIIDALNQNEIRIGPAASIFDPGASLGNEVAAVCEQLNIDRAKLARIPSIRRMPELLAFMQQNGALPD